MIVHKMTPAECRAVLARVRLGRLACVREDQPYIVPVALYLDPDDHVVYGFSTVGQKIHWMRDNPLVCIEVEEIVSRTHWATVVAFGRYEEIPRSGPGADARRRATDLFGTQVDWWLPGTATLSSGEQPTVPVIYRIRLGKVSGRRVHDGKEPAAAGDPRIG